MILTDEQAKQFLGRVTYEKVPWQNIRFSFRRSETWHVCLDAIIPSNSNPNTMVPFHVEIHPPTWMDNTVDEETLLYGALMCSLWLEEHEALECLRLDGETAYVAHQPGETVNYWLFQKVLMTAMVTGKGPRLRIDL